jgi:hypothetical protein
LYSLNCTLGPSIAVGSGPHGTRTVIPITGGTFSGPRLSGMDTIPSLPPPASDSQQRKQSDCGPRQGPRPGRGLGAGRPERHLLGRHAVSAANGRRREHLHPHERAGAARRASAPAHGVRDG